jgi:hypothetical protein
MKLLLSVEWSDLSRGSMVEVVASRDLGTSADRHAQDHEYAGCFTLKPSASVRHL